MEDVDKTQTKPTSRGSMTFPWMNLEKGETEMKAPSIIPLKSTSSELLKMQLFVEESDKKTS